MTLVPTATGHDIDSSDLGVTMMHEHIVVLSPEINQNYPETWGDEEYRVQSAVDELNDAKAHGVDTIVDVTVLGLGRYIPRIKRIAKLTDLNIVVATGVYTWDALPMFFNERGPGTFYDGPEFMVDMFVQDIQEGIADTGVRAGILKCATHKEGLTPGVERVLRATAQAHRRTGVPISTHTMVIPNAADQQRVFAEEGVDLSRVVIGHIDRVASQDLSYVEAVIRKGSFVSFDHFTLESIASDAIRVERIAELCTRGYANHIVLSHDHASYCDFVPADHAPNSRYTTVVDNILPALRDSGVSEDQINQMLIVNPRRIFESMALGAY